MKEKKVVFMGTPEFSVPVLKELIEKTNVKLVVTRTRHNNNLCIWPNNTKRTLRIS